MSEFFPLRVDHFTEEIGVPESKQEVAKDVQNGEKSVRCIHFP